MKKDQVYEIDIDEPLTAQRRAALEDDIRARAGTSPEPVSFAWDGDDDNRLHVKIGPVDLDISFADTLVTIAVDAPLWARVLVTAKKEEELQDLVVSILEKASFFRPEPQSA